MLRSFEPSRPEKISILPAFGAPALLRVGADREVGPAVAVHVARLAARAQAVAGGRPAS